jgi:hypothetical protein
VENVGGKAYGKATELYNLKHHKYSEQRNPWNPFQCTHHFPQAQSFCPQTKTRKNEHLRHGLDNYKIESFQSADALQKLLSELDFVLIDDSWIEDDSHLFGTLYYWDVFKCIQFLLVHLPFQKHPDFEPVRLADSAGHRINSEMNTGDGWWDTQQQHSAGATIVPVICASDKTHLTNVSGNQQVWPLYLTIGNIRNDVRWTLIMHSWIIVGRIPCPLKGANNIDEALCNTVGTVLSQLRHLDITGSGLKRDWADGLQQQCYPLLAAWVGDYLEQVMVAQVSCSSYQMCEIPKAALIGHSTFLPLDHSTDLHIY